MIGDPEDKALDAIYEEAERLLALPEGQRNVEAEGAFELISALARYKHDIRSVDEIKKARG